MPSWLFTERNKNLVLMVIALMIIISILRHFGLYEGFSEGSSQTQNIDVVVKPSQVKKLQ
jgi:hypothetical protein